MPNYDAYYKVDKCLNCKKEECTNCLVSDTGEETSKLSNMPLTKKNKDRIVELFNLGYSTKDISLELCRPRSTVYSFLLRSGLVKEKKFRGT